MLALPMTFPYDEGMSPLSGVLGEAWALYKRYASHFIAISFSVYLVIAVVSALLSWALGSYGAFIGLILTVFGAFLLQSALVKAVQDVRDGTVDLDLRETLRAALPFVGAVAVASILAAIGIGIGLILIIVPGLILLTFWSLIVPEIVIGGSSAFDSFARSWRTVRGYAWNVFGTLVLVWIISHAAGTAGTDDRQPASVSRGRRRLVSCAGLTVTGNGRSMDSGAVVTATVT